MSKRKIEESAQMIARYDVNTGLKAQKYTFVVIDDNILQFINTHLGGSFARKSVLRGTHSLCATLAGESGNKIGYSA